MKTLRKSAQKVIHKMKIRLYALRSAFFWKSLNNHYISFKIHPHLNF